MLEVKTIENEIENSFVVHEFAVLVFIWIAMAVMFTIANVLDCTGKCTVDAKRQKKSKSRVRLPEASGAAAAEADVVEPEAAPDKGECVDIQDVKVQVDEPAE
jgi:hypothetical protein